MFEKINYFTAFLIGFLSSGHCLGMCGGIVTIISLNFKNIQYKYIYHLTYNFARIFSYCIMAVITNIFGSIFFDLGGYYIFFLNLFQI